MSGFEHTSEGLARIRETYQTCVDLVDSHLIINDPARDEVPGYLRETSTTVRYHIAEQHQWLSTLPYTSALERSSVVAFQRLERQQPYRKLELLDPFRTIGGYTLLMLGMEDQERRESDVPYMSAYGEGFDYTNSRPFDRSDLTDDVLKLAETISDISRRGKLIPISFDDIQAMYETQSDIDRL